MEKSIKKKISIKGKKFDNSVHLRKKNNNGRLRKNGGNINDSTTLMLPSTGMSVTDWILAGSSEDLSQYRKTSRLCHCSRGTNKVAATERIVSEEVPQNIQLTDKYPADKNEIGRDEIQFDTRDADERNAEDIFLWLMTIEDSGSDSSDNSDKLLEEFIGRQNKSAKKQDPKLKSKKNSFRRLSLQLLKYNSVVKVIQDQQSSKRRASYTHDDRQCKLLQKRRKNNMFSNVDKTKIPNGNNENKRLMYDVAENNGITLEMNQFNDITIPIVSYEQSNEQNTDSYNSVVNNMPNKASPPMLGNSSSSSLENSLSVSSSISSFSQNESSSTSSIIVSEFPKKSVENNIDHLPAVPDNTPHKNSPNNWWHQNDLANDSNDVNDILPYSVQLSKDSICSSESSLYELKEIDNDTTQSTQSTSSELLKKTGKKILNKKNISRKCAPVILSIDRKRERYNSIQKIRRHSRLESTERRALIDYNALVPQISSIQISHNNCTDSSNTSDENESESDETDLSFNRNKYNYYAIDHMPNEKGGEIDQNNKILAVTKDVDKKENSDDDSEIATCSNLDSDTCDEYQDTSELFNDRNVVILNDQHVCQLQQRIQEAELSLNLNLDEMELERIPAAVYDQISRKIQVRFSESNRNKKLI